MLLLALAGAGCATRTVEAPPADPGTVIECDRARVVIPSGERTPPAGARTFSRSSTTIEVREGPLTVEAAGADFSVIAEGTVLLRLRTEGGRTFDEGPYRSVVIRNGTMIRR